MKDDINQSAGEAATRLYEQIQGMSDGQVADFAAARARSPIAQPSDKVGKLKAKVNEEAAALLTRLYAGERKLRQDGQKGIGEPLFRALESFCQQNHTELVPFDLLVASGDLTVNPSEVIGTASIALRNLAHNLCQDAPHAPGNAPQIMSNLAQMITQIQRITSLFGWTPDDLKLLARDQINAQRKGKRP